MFRKDTFRLIKSSFNRFFSLVMMVLIGVAFMMGLMSTKAVMKESVDKFNDEYVLHDIQIYSSFGFDEDDVRAIKNQKWSDIVFASKTLDSYCKTSRGTTLVARIEEIDRDINKVKLVSGRMPEAEDEMVILLAGVSTSTYPLDSEFTFFLEDDDIEESLKLTTYKIVGYVESPAYTSKVLGTSNLDNLDLDIVCYIQNDNFITDYYTCVYTTVTGASNLISYTDEYDELIESKMDFIEFFASFQQNNRKDAIIDEYTAEINEAKILLEMQKASAQQELDDAKAQLDSSNETILSSQAQIDAGRREIAENKQKLTEGEAELEANKKLLDDAVAQVIEADGQGRSFDEIYADAEEAYNTYTKLESIYNGEETEDSSIFLKGLGIVSRPGIKLVMYQMDQSAGGSVKDAYEQLKQVKDGLDAVEAAEKEISDGWAQINAAEVLLDASQAQLNAGKSQYDDGYKEYEDGVYEFNSEIEKAELEIKKAEQELEDLPDAQWIVLDRDSHYSSYMYKGSCDQMGSIGTALPVLFFLVAALVCMTTMTRLIDEQRGQIGIFRALGFSNGKIVGKYVVYSLMASLLGSIPGLVVGMALFPTVIYNTWRLMYILPDMQLIIKPGILVICVLSFTVLMAGVSAVVARNSLKDEPAQLLRPKAPKNAKPVFLEKIHFIWNKLSFTSKITARNLIRYKARFFMTVLGVAGCTSLLVVGWGIKDSISDVVDIQYGDIFAYNYTVNIEDDRNLDEFVKVISEDENVEFAAPIMEYTSKLYKDNNDKTMYVDVINSEHVNEIFNFRNKNGVTEIDLDNTGVFVSEKFARVNNIKKGDTITIESKNGIKGEVVVADICEMYFQHYIFMTEEYYNEVFGETVHPEAVALVAENGMADVSKVKELEGFVSLVNFDAMIEQFQTMLEALDFIILVIIATAGALALVVLINLTQVNISERLREIATLKVLGFREGEVDSYLFKEIGLLSVIGGLVGLPLGVIEHHFIMRIIDMEMVQFGMNIKALSFFYAFAVTMIFTVVVLILTRKPLREIKMVESLKSVE